MFEVASGDLFSQTLFAGIRFMGAGLIMLAVLTIKDKKVPKVTKPMLPGTVLLALTQTALQYFFYYVGLAHTSGVRGAIINATNVFATVILSGLIFRSADAITPKKIVGCIIGVLGVVVVNVGGGVGGEPFTIIGEGFMILSVLCLAISNPLTKILTQRIDPAVISAWQLTFGGGLLLIIGLVTGGHLTWVGLKGVLLTIFMMLITAVTFPIWTNLLKLNPVSKISIYNFFTPIFGVIMSAVILGEDARGIRLLVALFLVCSGIILINYEFKKPEKAA